MTQETINEIFAEYLAGVSNTKFGVSTKFGRRSIIRGIKIRTGDVEKERPLLVLTNCDKVNLNLLTIHLSVAPIHTKPNNDFSIPIILDYFGDNTNRVSFVDPIKEFEVLFFETFPKVVQRSITCPDSVFDLIMEVKQLMQIGNVEKALSHKGVQTSVYERTRDRIHRLYYHKAVYEVS